MKHLLIILLFTGCVNAKKATRYFNEHKEKAAEYCSVTFPVKDSIVTRDSVSFDTLWIPCDTVPHILLGDSSLSSGYHLNVIKYGDSVMTVKRVPCVSKTVYRDTTIYRRDFARETFLEAKIDELYNANIGLFNENSVLKKEVKAYKDRLRGKVLIPWWVFVLLAGLGYLTARFKLLKIFL